jgi:hypothetical protein
MIVAASPSGLPVTKIGANAPFDGVSAAGETDAAEGVDDDGEDDGDGAALCACASVAHNANDNGDRLSDKRSARGTIRAR